MPICFISYGSDAQQKRSLRDISQLEDTVAIGDAAFHKSAVNRVENSEVDKRNRLAGLLVEKQTRHSESVAFAHLFLWLHCWSLHVLLVPLTVAAWTLTRTSRRSATRKTAAATRRKLCHSRHSRQNKSG